MMMLRGTWQQIVAWLLVPVPMPTMMTLWWIDPCYGHALQYLVDGDAVSSRLWRLSIGGRVFPQCGEMVHASTYLGR